MPKSPIASTIDLTQEFKASSSVSSLSQSGKSPPSSFDRDLEKGESSPEEGTHNEDLGSGASYLQEFEKWMNLHDQVKGMISKMTKTTESIKKLHTQALMNNVSDSKQIDSLVAGFDEDAVSVRHHVNILKATIPSKQANQFQVKFEHIQKRFLDCLGSYQTVLRQQRNKYLEYLERQCRIVNPQISSAELDRVQQALAPGQISGDPHLLLQSTNIFSQALKADAQRGLLLLEERLTEMQRLEASTKEISQIYNELALLVSRQGETIKRLHEHVQGTEVYTEAAKKETKAAIQKAKLKRSFLKWLIIIGIILLAVTIFYLVFSAMF
jgi:syntaxin 1B/2/3